LRTVTWIKAGSNANYSLESIEDKTTNEELTLQRVRLFLEEGEKSISFQPPWLWSKESLENETAMKTQAFFLVRPGESAKDGGLDSLMECIFYKNPRLVKVAKAIFDETVRKGHYDASRWKSFIQEHEVKESGYYAVISRLSALGLIKRNRRRYYISRDFSRFLDNSAQVWDETVRKWRVRSLFETF